MIGLNVKQLVGAVALSLALGAVPAKAQQFIKDRLLPKPPAKTGGAPTP